MPPSAVITEEEGQSKDVFTDIELAEVELPDLGALCAPGKEVPVVILVHDFTYQRELLLEVIIPNFLDLNRIAFW